LQCEIPTVNIVVYDLYVFSLWSCFYILQGQVKALEFHPSAQVALTGGLNNTLSLFQVSD